MTTQVMLTTAEAKLIAREIAAKERQVRRVPSGAVLSFRSLASHYQGPEIRALVPHVRGEVFDHAMNKLHDLRAYNLMSVASLLAVGAPWMLPPLSVKKTIVLAVVVTPVFIGSLVLRLVYVRRAVRLISTELAQLGY